MRSEIGTKEGDSAGREPGSVFVSYSHVDQKSVLPIISALEQAGYIVWWDGKLEGGERYLKATEAALEGASSVVVLWSKSSTISHWVHDEAMRGRDRNCLVPISIDGSEPPLGFRQFQTIDLSRPGRKLKAVGIEAMLRAVAALHGRPAPVPAAESRNSRLFGSDFRRRPLYLWVAAVLVACLIGAAGWWFLRPAPMRTHSLALARLETIGPGVPAELPASLDSEFRAAFAHQDIALQSGPADLLLRGTVQRAGDTLRFTVRVDDVASGTTLWTTTQNRPVGQPVTQLAGPVVTVVDCVVGALDRYRGELPVSTQDLMFEYCENAHSNGSPRRGLDLARRITRATPDFFHGWIAINETVGFLEMNLPSQVTPALRAEAEAAARRAIALDPKSADGYSRLAQFLPRPVEREATLRRAISVRPEECRCAYQTYGDFLVQTGRVEEAIAMYRRGLDQERAAPIAFWRAAMAQHVAGRPRQGDEHLRALTAVPGNPPLTARRRGLLAAWNERWMEAIEVVDPDRPEEGDAIREAMLALASRDPARIERAGAAVAAIPLQGENEQLIVPTLSVLGRTDAAMAGLEWSRRNGGAYSAPGRLPGLTRPLLFDPRLRRLFRDPRFPAFLQRAGFIAYWRESRTRPDVCRVAGAPPFCRMLG